MCRNVMIETVDKEVTLYDNNEVLIEGKLFEVAIDSYEKSGDIMQDICKKLNAHHLELLGFKYGNLLSLHRVLYNDQF